MLTDDHLLRRGMLLEYTTLGWNLAGSAVVFFAALQASSVALAGFGFDSLIEIGASIVVVWQLRGSTGGRDRAALRLIGLAFLLLALYILAQSLYAFASSFKPDPSWLGIGWLTATVVAMVALAVGKHRTGLAMGNRILAAESRVTLIDAYLAAAVLAGLLLNATLGWWWADPAAALTVCGYALREAWMTLAF